MFWPALVCGWVNFPILWLHTPVQTKLKCPPGPFGLSQSPFVFTKLLRPLVKYWRLHGLLIVVYIDDGICITIGLEEAKRNSKFVRDTLIAAGLFPDVEKSNW